MPNTNIVRVFVEKLKQPEYLLSGCKKYWERNFPDSAYTALSQYMNSNKDLERNVKAASSFLFDWNWRYYAKKKIKDDKQLKIEINRIYRIECSDFFKARKDDTLSTISLMDNAVSKGIQDIFKEFYNSPEIGPIGAAKVLHFLLPRLFVPWDNNIWSAYHRLHERYGHRPSEKDEECYLEFLNKCKEVSDGLISKVSEDQLTKMHPAFKDVAQMRYIPKMIDECNYEYFTNSDNIGFKLSS